MNDEISERLRPLATEEDLATMRGAIEIGLDVADHTELERRLRVLELVIAREDADSAAREELAALLSSD